MKIDCRFRPGWLVRRLPLVAAAILATACSDSTAPVVTPTKYIVTEFHTTARVGDTVLVDVQLADANDHFVAVSGRTVTWFPSDGDGRFVDHQTQTNANGVAGNLFVLGTKPGAGVPIRVVDDKQIEGNAPAIAVLAGEPSGYAVTASSLTAPVNTSVSLFAQLVDKYGNPLPIADRVVSWSIDSTNDGGYYYQRGVLPNRLSPSVATNHLAAPTHGRRAATPGGTFSTPTSTTNSQGIATVDFVVGVSASQSYIVVAKDQSAVSGTSLPIAVTGGPIAKLVVTVSVIDPPAGAPVSISAYPLDAYDNRIAAAGIQVSWSITGSGGTLGSSVTTAGADGTTENVLTTGGSPSTTYTVSVSAPVGSSQATGTSPAITTLEQVALSSLSTGFGSQSSCGIASDGKVWCWGAPTGSPSRTIPGRPIGNQTMSALSTSGFHTCGISVGTVLCWGSDAAGELGDNARISRDTPAPINSSLSFSAVSAGTAHTCAVATTGEIYCWGFSDSGRLGDGTGFNGLGPIKVAGTVTFTAVSAGDSHTCAIATSGDAYCWGRNDRGQLGIGTFIGASTPTLVGGGLKFTAIAVGFQHTCGIAGGTVYCWGDNILGEIGDGTAANDRTAPTAVKSTAAFVTLAAGGANTCAIRSDGRAYCWGDNTTRQIGDPNFSAALSNQPIAVPDLTFKSIAVGGSGTVQDYYYGTSGSGHVCGITTGGVTYCWGSDTQGELGISSVGTSNATPSKVSGQQ